MTAGTEAGDGINQAAAAGIPFVNPNYTGGEASGTHGPSGMLTRSEGGEWLPRPLPGDVLLSSSLSNIMSWGGSEIWASQLIT